MPYPNMYGLWVQPVTNTTTPANVEKYGEIQTLEELIETGDSPLSCGGQTSPTGPRYADDQMGMLWFYSESAAEYAQASLRQSIIRRSQMGQLNLPVQPLWFANVSAASQANIPSLRSELRDELQIDAAVTDSQLDSALRLYMIQTGDTTPTAQAFNRWLLRHRAWAHPLPLLG